MTLRRLLLALLLSIVVGIAATSVARVDGFSAGQLGIQSRSSVLVHSTYDEASTFSVEGVAQAASLGSGAGFATWSVVSILENTPSGAVTDATDESGSLLGDLAQSCATNSFTAGTLVVMADGTTKTIGQVKVGDKVEGTDPATGKTVAATVSRLFLNDDHSLADVLVRGASGATNVLHATQGHRFWDQTRNQWVLTTQIRAGDILRSDDGSQVTVEAIHSWQGSEWMYDLTVDGVHTFYVLAGSSSMLVHNCLAPPPGPEDPLLSDIMANGKAIAGAGTTRPLWDIARIVQEYGGDPYAWTKMTTTIRDLPTQLHWLENLETGAQVEPKWINWYP